MVSEAERKLLQIFNPLWDRARTEYFKLETLQRYDIEDERVFVDPWERGERERAIRALSDVLNSNSFLKDANSRGVRLLRVHLVDLPLSSYVQLEMEGYSISKSLGEHIFLATKDEFAKKITTDLKLQDFVLIDNETLILQGYDNQGKFVSFELVDRPDEVGKYVSLKKQLLSIAVPFEDFRHQYLPDL